MQHGEPELFHDRLPRWLRRGRGGKFDWAAPDEEVHAAINDLARPIGTYLLGRRMYEVLAYWDSPPALGDQSPAVQTFAEVWRAADKVVYSKTLDEVSTARTRIERDFDPEMIRELKAQSERDLAIAGPDLAAQAIRAGLVDDYQLFVTPMVVGGGRQFLRGDTRLRLQLLDERRFRHGTVFLRYSPAVIAHRSRRRNVSAASRAAARPRRRSSRGRRRSAAPC